MMTMIYFFIASSLALAAKSQLHNFHLGILNPDLVYFNDGGQRFPALIPTRNPQPILNSRLGDNNQRVIVESQRVPVNMIPQLPGESDAGNTGNFLNAPSTHLEPPHLSDVKPKKQVVFETADRFADAVDDKVPNGVGQMPVVYPVLGQAPVEKVSLAVSQFGINVMKSLQQQPGNVVVSPYSIATLLALLQQGSLGATQQQITNALQMNPNEAADGFKKLSENLKKRRSLNILKSANGLFLSESFNVNPAFKRIGMNDFDCELSTIKFSRPEQAADKINNWISSKTNKKIDKLVTAESVGENTQLVLVNAVYFKGLWQVKFRPETTMQNEFYLSNGGRKVANFMRMRRYFRADYDTTISSQILILPFEGDQYSLVVILPSASATVASALSALTTDKLLAYQNITAKEVALELPKFTIKSDTNLISVFRQLGIVNMFGPASELSGLGSYREFSPQVSSALHSALLSVDEQGGTAAAATSFGVVALSYDDPSIIFKANRPFLAVLWDKQTSLPLFMAKVEDPVS